MMQRVLPFVAFVLLLGPLAASAAAPANQIPPSYLWWSNYRVGLHIGVDPGTWTDSPAISYQWQVSADGTSGWTNEADAFAQSAIRESIALDACKYLRARVTATNADGLNALYTPVSPRIQPLSGSCTPPPPSCGGFSSMALTALSDLGTGSYQGFPGGLYPDGSDSPPASYAAEGAATAALVQPRSGHGAPSPNGKIGLLSLGMSNASLEWSTFLSSWMSSSLRNPAVQIVNGAQSGMTLDAIVDPTTNFWNVVASRMGAAGVSSYQVQVIWLKDTIGEPAARAGTFPASAQLAKSYMRAVIDTAAGFFPNLRLVYISTRIYSGYSTGIESLSPEPWAYEDGFAAKWLIEDRIASGTGPWIAWGPYLWANGIVSRSDGYSGTRTWLCGDFQTDGVHPSESGVAKVSGALGDFFSNDPTARGWFLAP